LNSPPRLQFSLLLLASRVFAETKNACTCLVAPPQSALRVFSLPRLDTPQLCARCFSTLSPRMHDLNCPEFCSRSECTSAPVFFGNYSFGFGLLFWFYPTLFPSRSQYKFAVPSILPLYASLYDPLQFPPLSAGGKKVFC